MAAKPIALITGASNGIRFELAKIFANNGVPYQTAMLGGATLAQPTKFI